MGQPEAPVVIPSQNARSGSLAISSEDWNGCCVAKMDKTRGLVSMLLCIFLGGLGTCISGCLDDSGCNCGIVCLGILQIILLPFVVGYIWSIITGVMTFVCAYGTL